MVATLHNAPVMTRAASRGFDRKGAFMACLPPLRSREPMCAGVGVVKVCGYEHPFDAERALVDGLLRGGKLEVGREHAPTNGWRSGESPP
jgi:hypothetical protein